MGVAVKVFDQMALPPDFEVDFEWTDPAPTFIVDRYGGVFTMTVDTTPRPWWKLLVLRPWWRWQAWRFDRELRS